MPHPNKADLQMSDGKVCCQTQQQQRGLVRHTRNVLPHACLLVNTTILGHDIAAATAWSDCNTLRHILANKDVSENVT